MWGGVGYLGRVHAVIYAALGTKCTFLMLPYRTPPYRTLLPILPYTMLPTRLYPKSILSYPFHTVTVNTPRFPSIYILLHSTLSYSSVP